MEFVSIFITTFLIECFLAAIKKLILFQATNCALNKMIVLCWCWCWLQEKRYIDFQSDLLRGKKTSINNQLGAESTHIYKLYVFVEFFNLILTWHNCLFCFIFRLLWSMFQVRKNNISKYCVRFYRTHNLLNRAHSSKHVSQYLHIIISVHTDSNVQYLFYLLYYYVKIFPKQKKIFIDFHIKLGTIDIEAPKGAKKRRS